MKLVNYNRGWNNTFNCSIHGTIYMDQNEWTKAKKYLLNIKDNPNRYLFKDTLRVDIKRHELLDNGFALNVRVSYTRKLADYFNLDKYKVGNYQIIVRG